MHHGIFRSLAYLMSEVYSNHCQIPKIMKHIENPGIIRTIHLGIFRHIQGHPAIFRDIKAYWAIFWHCWGILSHIQTYSLHNPCKHVSIFQGFLYLGNGGNVTPTSQNLLILPPLPASPGKIPPKIFIPPPF